MKKMYGYFSPGYLFFQPADLPFTMQMQAWQHSQGGNRVTINFYANGTMIKTLSSSETIYDMRYTVQ